jgi:hypothetical protein
MPSMRLLPTRSCKGGVVTLAKASLKPRLAQQVAHLPFQAR